METKILTRSLWGISLFILLLTVGVYLFNFRDYSISSNPEQWGQFGDYLGGVLNPMLSLVNLIILTYLTIKLVNKEEDRNNKTLRELARPYPTIIQTLSLTGCKVVVKNIGLGPMKLMAIKVTDKHGNIYPDFGQLASEYRAGDVEFKIHYADGKNGIIVGKDETYRLFDVQLSDSDDVSFEEFNHLLEGYSIESSYYDIYDEVIGVLKHTMAIDLV